MKEQSRFQRYELKYLITKEQQEWLKEEMAEYMCEDSYGKSTIRNIYYDTPDYLLIRRSLEKPIYKEKLRIRSYVGAKPDSMVFVELKKKYNGVVYKRRISMKEKDAMNYLEQHKMASLHSQIGNEIHYFCKYYHQLKPAVFLSYDREAFYAKEDEDFRITFDENIVWRNMDLSLCKEVYGERLLPEDMVLMEVKTRMALPLWITGLFNKNHIYKTSFSKYGAAYQNLKEKGEVQHVS